MTPRTEAEKQQVEQTSQHRQVSLQPLLLWLYETPAMHNLCALPGFSHISFTPQLLPPALPALRRGAVASLCVRAPSALCLLPCAAAEELQDQKLVGNSSQKRAPVTMP